MKQVDKKLVEKKTFNSPVSNLNFTAEKRLREM